MSEKIKTAVLVNSNEIEVPMEWITGLNFISRYVQITFVYDRIVIHNPLNTAVKYTAPRKVDDNSYIRSFGLFDIKIPKLLLDKLNIKDGDKIDLYLEKNCISIRKNDEIAPQQRAVVEPVMAFCCICGNLFYTDGLVSISKKHICDECIDAIKAL